MPNPLRADPTRTKTLRDAYVRDVTRRFDRLRRRIHALIVSEDVFGLKPSSGSQRLSKALGGSTGTNTLGSLSEALETPARPLKSDPSGLDKYDKALLTANERWAFLSDDRKIDEFNGWLNDQVNGGILETVDGKKPDEPWQAEYVRRAYAQGTERAYADTNKVTSVDGDDFYQGGKQQFLQDSFNSPVSVARVRSLYTRNFEGLRNVTTAMSTQMSRTLAQSFATGAGALATARALERSVDGIGRTRARTLARTEIIHAHSEGQLDAYEKLGAKELGVMAEWSTAGDAKVCPKCKPLEASLIKVDKARGLIPRHPNCRCTWMPANVGEPPEGQKRSKTDVKKAVGESLKEETGERTLKAARKKSRWAGADLEPGGVPKGVKKAGKKTVKKATKKTTKKKVIQKGELPFADSDIFYHGSQSKFDSFDLAKLHSGADKSGESWYGHGAYLTGRGWKGHAYSFTGGAEDGYVYKFKTTVKNPLVVKSTDAFGMADALRELGLPPDLKNAELTKTLKGLGYDSIAVLDDEKVINELVAFDPKDLKMVERIHRKDWKGDNYPDVKFKKGFKPKQKEDPPPTASLTVAPSEVERGQDVAVHWSSTNAETATLNGTPVRPLGGDTFESGPGTPASWTFTLVVKGPGGSASASRTVRVVEPKPPPIKQIPRKGQKAPAGLSREEKVFWHLDNNEELEEVRKNVVEVNRRAKSREKPINDELKKINEEEKKVDYHTKKYSLDREMDIAIAREYSAKKKANIQKKIDDLNADHRKRLDRKNQLKKDQERLKDQRKLEVREAISLPKEQRANVSVKMNPEYLTETGKQRAREAGEFYEAATYKSRDMTYTVNTMDPNGTNQRAYQSGRGYNVSRNLKYHGEDPTRTHVHEAGHVVEELNQDALENSVAFRDRRIRKAGTKDERIEGYEAHEIGNEDDFGKFTRDKRQAQYVGKKYKSPFIRDKDTATEITPMIAERVYDGEDIAETDPEAFKHFIATARDAYQ